MPASRHVRSLRSKLGYSLLVPPQGEHASVASLERGVSGGASGGFPRLLTPPFLTACGGLSPLRGDQQILYART